MVANRYDNQPGFARGRQTRQPDEHDSRGVPPLSENQLAEVLIPGEEDGVSGRREGQHGVVIEPRLQLGHIRNLVPVLSEGLDDRSIDTLVGDELQAASSGVGYTTSAFRA